MVQPKRTFAGWRLWLSAGAFAVVVAGLLTWAFWPAEEQPRARQYLDFTACLLTDDHGIGGSAAAPVWAGMQKASLATRAKVQYVEVTGPQTPENALPFLNSLAQSRCTLVFAAGTAPVAAVRDGAARFPETKFYVVGTSITKPNVSTVDGKSADEIRDAVARVLTDAVKAS
jgi:basic membrane lipoprotein Med (substrate-binding protein (PBP1-ABC) superfamily)